MKRLMNVIATLLASVLVAAGHTTLPQIADPHSAASPAAHPEMFSTIPPTTTVAPTATSWTTASTSATSARPAEASHQGALRRGGV